MSQIIAGIYEIEKQIGAGGGGIVYLGRHLRLKKQVVLKADKRTLSTGTDVLRREVDMLKELSHTYIPQVYDFVQENGVVYTVMDFIDGESLDKLLARRQKLTQPQIIGWACQLLEALSYLHSRPPHGILHGDIKPANIMLRPGGDVCLIDFNIALALGEDGAVKVGFSRGYASPEHYGADYIRDHKPAAVGQGSVRKIPRQIQSFDTVRMENKQGETRTYQEKTVTLPVSSPLEKSTTGGSRGILLDVRSDIYSLGATLYHLLSGCRPESDALEVKPLGLEVCSPEVSAILQKAMAPDPKMRYQSAKEMLEAFLQLHKRDRRVIRHKKRIRISSALLVFMFLFGGACTFTGLKQLEQIQTALALAEYSADALGKGDVSGAIEQALQAIPRGKSILEAPVTAQAQKALTDALGVYNLKEGFHGDDLLELPSVPFCITASPEGNYFAVVYAYETAVFDIRSQERIAVLPAQKSALSDAVFVDETHLVYAGEQGVTAYDLKEQKVLWTGEAATTLAISADRKVIAAVDREEDHAVIYRAADGGIIKECSFSGLHLAVAANDIFADPENNIFALNENGSRLAVSFYNGGLTIFDLQDSLKDLVIYEESDYKHFEGGFSGHYFAFTANKPGKALFGLVDTQKAAYVGGTESQDPFLLKTDEQGIYLARGNVLVRFDPDTLEEKELAYTNHADIKAFFVGKEYTVAAADNRSFSFYDSGAHVLSTESCSENCDFVVLTDENAILGNRSEPSLRLLRLERYKDKELLSYDARYPHDEARISEDGQTAMLFSYKGFRIYRMDGSLVTETELPDKENIYDQQFRRNEGGSWLEVIWYDGTVRNYDAADGTLILEEVRERPSKDLYEEFYVGEYCIASSLHEAPEVYDAKSGKLAARLEEDSYLTYVTQAGEYIITEYISAEGERYGLLLNEDFEKLAYLPGLCDVFGDMLVFDYKSGNLRQCRLHSLQELIALGETYLQNTNERGTF